MSVGVFVDKEHRPDVHEINDMLGAARVLWDNLVQFIVESYDVPGALSYGGQKYGWNIWYRQSGKTLVNLYPQERYFVAQVVLGKEQAEQASQLDFGESVARVFNETSPLHDGRWLFINVSTEEDVNDIKQLLQIKRLPKPSRRTTG